MKIGDKGYVIRTGGSSDRVASVEPGVYELYWIEPDGTTVIKAENTSIGPQVFRLSHGEYLVPTRDELTGVEIIVKGGG